MDLVTQMNNRYHILCCAYQEALYLYLEGVQTVPDAVENLRKGIALGGLDTFGAVARPVQDDSKPTVILSFCFNTSVYSQLFL